MDYFEAAYPIIFRQTELFNNLVSYRILRHRDLIKKGKIVRYFSIGDIVVVRKQVNSGKKYGVVNLMIQSYVQSYCMTFMSDPISFFLYYNPIPDCSHDGKLSMFLSHLRMVENNLPCPFCCALMVSPKT